LLAFTLERLYAEYRGGGHLKAEHYVRLGGIAGSIETAVEQALKVADADPKIPRDRQARLALLSRHRFAAPSCRPAVGDPGRGQATHGPISPNALRRASDEATN
jgi:hypothetical protein